jgi:hypothetical protein
MQKNLIRKFKHDSMLLELEQIVFENGQIRISSVTQHLLIKKPNFVTKLNFGINIKDFLGILEVCPTADVKIIQDKEGNMNSARFKDGVKTITLPVSEPNTATLPDDEFKPLGTVNLDMIGQLIKAKPFLGKDELRPAMLYVYMNHMIAATDAHTLFYEPTMGKIKGEVLISPNTVTLLPDIGECKLYEGDGWLKFDNSLYTLYQRISGERYPEFERVIPTKNPHKVYVHTRELISALKGFKLGANKITTQLSFDFAGRKMFLYAYDLENNTAFNSELKMLNPIIKNEGITVNGSFFQKLIDPNAEHTLIEFSESNRAMIINKNRLVMPVLKQQSNEHGIVVSDTIS